MPTATTASRTSSAQALGALIGAHRVYDATPAPAPCSYGCLQSWPRRDRRFKNRAEEPAIRQRPFIAASAW